MKLPNINEIAVSVIHTRTPVSKIHFSNEAAKSALGIVARDNKFNVGYRALLKTCRTH